MSNAQNNNDPKCTCVLNHRGGGLRHQLSATFNVGQVPSGLTSIHISIRMTLRLRLPHSISFLFLVAIFKYYHVQSATFWKWYPAGNTKNAGMQPNTHK